MQKSRLGYLLATANGYVVYTYGNDTKGGQPTCTSSCAALWTAVTGIPATTAGVTLPGTLGTVTLPNGAKQITYDGLPLYLLKSAKALSTKGNGMDGVWHVVLLPASALTGG